MTDTAHTPEGHKDVSHDKTGILMISLGTPDAPTYGAVRRYLAEFLGDKRVIETPRPIWLPILYGPILTFRPLRSAKAYQKVWNTELDESPLRTIARSQAEKMQDMMPDNVCVDWAFTYGSPSIEDGLMRLQQKGCQKILLFALYPQYSATTTAAAYDRAFAALGKMRWQPAIRTLDKYCDRSAYVTALAGSVRASLDALDFEPDHILASYHSIPKSYLDKGDPYPCQCHKTSRLLSQALDLPDGKLVTSFQSRVGPTEWVSPYTDKTVIQLAQSGIKKLAVVAPAFSADCLETLEEINMELRETFLHAGGTHFHYIPCLNDSPSGMAMFADVARQELSGWV